MRKQFLTVLLPVLVILITASAQTQSAGTDAPKHAALQKVNVVRTSDGFSVEISARGTVKPRLSTLDSPARIVVDLPNTVVATSRGHIAVDGDGVKDVRLGMDGQGSSRVVVDLTKACRHELVAGSDNTLVLKLYTKSEVAQASQPATVKAPVVQPVVAKTEVAAAPVAPVAPVVAELAASGQGSQTDSDFRSRHGFRVHRAFLLSQGRERRYQGCSDRASRAGRHGCRKICLQTRWQPVASGQRRHAVERCATGREHGR